MLTDINNTNIDGIIIGEDGVVYGHIGGMPTASLSEQWCTTMQKNWNPTLNKCFWSVSPFLNTFNDINVVFPTQQVILTDPKPECRYTFSFEYIFEIDSDEILDVNNFTDKFNQMIPKFTWNYSGSPMFIYEFDNRSLYDKIMDSTKNSGLYVTGSRFNVLKTAIGNQLGISFSENKLKSGWLSFSKVLDESELTNLYMILMGMSIVKPFKGLKVKIDNIKVNEICDNETNVIRYVNTNPSFEFERIVDNKKTWTVEDQIREHDILWRETDYYTDDDRLIVNSKEIDLALSYNNAIEENFVAFLKNNQYFVWFLQGNDFLLNDVESRLLNSSLNTQEYLKLFLSMINNPTNYRTTNLNMIVYYLISDYLKENTLNFENLTPIINKLDKYWVDILAQFVPSTTIWESNIIIGGNNILREKFKYRPFRFVKNSSDSIAPSINVNMVEEDIEFNNISMSFNNYNMGGEYYSEGIDIQYNVVLMPVFISNLTSNSPITLCGRYSSPMLTGWLYNLEVGETIFDDDNQENVFIGVNEYYPLSYNEHTYYVKINTNGVIMDIIDSDSICVEVDHISFRIYNTDVMDTPETSCVIPLPSRYNTLYASSFNVGEQTFLNQYLTAPNPQPYNTTDYYIVIYDNQRYAVAFNSNGQIAEIHLCNEVLQPAMPKLYYVEGGGQKAYVTIRWEHTTIADYFELEIAPIGTNDWITEIIPFNVGDTETIIYTTQGGMHQIRVRAITNGANPSAYDSSEILIFGYALFSMRETPVDPCMTFPPNNVTDSQIYTNATDLSEIRQGSELFINSEMTVRFRPTSTISRVSIGDLDGENVISTTVNQNGVITSLNPCSSTPAPVDIAYEGAEDPTRFCNYFNSIDKLRVYNDGGFRIGSRFYLDVELTEPLNMNPYSNRYMVAKVPNETQPRYIYIENDVVASIGRTCN